MTSKFALFAVLSTTAAAHAEDLPKPVAELERFVGSWKLAGTLTLGKDLAKLEGSLVCKRTSGNAGVLCALHATGIPGAPPLEETDLFGYEPNSATYHWYAITNVGETHDHVARSIAGDKVRFTYTGTQDGKPLTEVIDFGFAKDGKAIDVHSETTVARASVAVLAMRATR